MSEYKATNIDWDLNAQDAAEYAMNDLDDEDFEQIFQTSRDNLDVDEVTNKIRHEPALGDAVYGLPNEVVIPADVVKDAVEDKTPGVITDYLFDYYGYSINSYELPKALETAIEKGHFEKEAEPER